MTSKIHYTAIGEEATRGTAESSTVGFIPLSDPTVPKLEFKEEKRAEWRGEQVALGNREKRRSGQSWSASFNTPLFTEAGTTAGMIGTILKHFFGKGTSAQNASTGQYYHMFYKVADMFNSSNLGTTALTVNTNMSKGETTLNHPFTGGRVTQIEFTQEIGAPLQFGFEMIGQKRDATGTAIASPAFAAENLRLDFNNLTMYTGTITRTGTGPDFTEFAFGSATQLNPDNVKLTLGNGVTDKTVHDGNDYPTKSIDGEMSGTLEFTIDFEDPAAGFSSVDDFEAWVSASSSTNFFLQWDTGTQAGTGDNHMMGIDLPICKRMGGDPTFTVEDEVTITLSYDLLFDASTTSYLAGLLLKNTAAAV